MSAPIIWVIFPLLAGVLFLLLIKWQNLIYFLGIILTSWLTWIAWVFPINQVINIGENSFKLGESFTILGRSLIISEIDKPLLIFIFGFATLWMIGGLIVKPSIYFPSYVLWTVSLLISALSVEPFLYASLIIEIVVLLSVSQIILSKGKVGKGIFRFLSLFTLGMPFILFTGWMLLGAEVSPDNLDIIMRAGILLGLGFSFLLFFIPFHNWIPMLSEEAHPYIFAFLLFFLPGVEVVFGLGFINQLAWLRNSTELLLLLRGMGVLMILLGGIWAFTENSLSRLFGYLVIFDMGWNLLIMSLNNFTNINLFFYGWFLTGIFYCVIGLALSKIKEFNWDNLTFDSLQGIAKLLPVESIAIVISLFSLTGVPLFSTFPIYINILKQLNNTSSSLTAWVMIGVLFMVGSSLKLINILFIEERLIEVEDGGEYVHPISKFIFRYSTDPNQASKWFVIIFLLLLSFILGIYPIKIIDLFDNFSLIYNQFGL